MPTSTTADATLPDRVQVQAAERGEKRFVTFLADGDRDETTLTFAQLEARALAVAGAATARGLVPGDRVLIMLPSGLDFIETFFGLGLAGLVPVPVYPPARLARLEHHLRTVATITETAGCRGAVLDERLVPLVERHVGFKNQAILTDAELRAARSPGQVHPVGPGDLAFLQFTSGTTSAPRGVRLEQRHVLAQLDAYCQALRLEPQDVVVSWLPLYHDLGLVGMVLASLHRGSHLVLLSPTDFLKEPLCWLRACSRHKGVHTAAPNFAFELVARKCPPERLKAEAIDLSSLDNVGMGGEPVSFSTVERFRAHLAPFGLRPGVLNPCYGLAENVLVATGHRRGQPLRTVTVSQAGLQQNQVREPAGDADRATLPGNGAPFPGMAVRIAGPEGQDLGERAVGEVHVRSPSLASGYAGDKDATAATFIESGGERWLRTGDLGFLAAGDLYICGRKKDLMIVRGRNLHPQDLEQEVGRVEGVRTGNVVAFSNDEGNGQGEVAVVVAELDPKAPRPEADVRRDITEALSAAFQLALREVRLVAAGTIPKTSSGKLQRGLVKEAWVRGDLDAFTPPGRAATTWLQARLALADLGRRLRGRRAGSPVAVTAAAQGDLDPRFADALARVRPEAPPQALHPAVRVEALGLDSLERVELWLQLAGMYEAKVPDDAWSASQTLGEVQALLEKHAGTAPPGAARDDGSSLLVRDLQAPLEGPRPAFRRPLTAPVLFGGLSLTTRACWGWRVEGQERLEREGGLILAGNHATYFDGAWMWNALPPGARERLVAFSWAGLPWFTRAFLAQMDTIPIDPEGSFREAIRAGRQALETGRIVLIFPEGLRTHSGALAPFRPGVGLLSLLSGRPIVPFRSRGMFEVFPRDRVLPRLLRSKGQPPVDIRFGAPLDPPALVPGRAWGQAQEVVRGLRAAVEAL